MNTGTTFGKKISKLGLLAGSGLVAATLLVGVTGSAAASGYDRDYGRGHYSKWNDRYDRHHHRYNHKHNRHCNHHRDYDRSYSRYYSHYSSNYARDYRW